MGLSTSILDLAASILAGLGASSPGDIIQTMLVQDGYFVGWKFCYDGGQAIARAGSDTIDLYDEQGNLLRTVDLAQSRRAVA